jgi:hypothetical protein
MIKRLELIELMAKRIVGDLNREGLLSSGYELIGYLSLMIKEELRFYCIHQWIPIPKEVTVSPTTLDCNPTLTSKICVLCGEFYR